MISLRGLERRAKQLLIFRLSTWMLPAKSPMPPQWASRPHHVLVLRYDRIGDMILSTGIIKAMALAQPNLRVDVLASSQNRAVLDGNPYVGRVLIIDRRRPWTWIPAILWMRRARYDAVVDVMVMAPSLTTTLVMLISGARHRIGLGDRGNQAALTMPVARLPGAVHYVDHSAALLAAFGGEPPSGIWSAATTPRKRSGGAPANVSDAGGWGIWRPEIFLTAAESARAEQRWRRVQAAALPAEDGRRLIVNVSAGAHWRYWPAACFVETLTAVKAAFPNLQLLIIGAPQDAQRMLAIGRACAVDVEHTPRSRDMMALVAAADVVLTADTAVTHVASAFEKSVLALFARSKADLWGPYAVPGGAVSTPAASLQSLPVADVLPTLLDLIWLEVLRRPHRLQRVSGGETRDVSSG